MFFSRTNKGSDVIRKAIQQIDYTHMLKVQKKYRSINYCSIKKYHDRPNASIHTLSFDYFIYFKRKWRKILLRLSSCDL